MSKVPRADSRSGAGEAGRVNFSIVRPVAVEAAAKYNRVICGFDMTENEEESCR